MNLSKQGSHSLKKKPENETTTSEEKSYNEGKGQKKILEKKGEKAEIKGKKKKN
jgi:hypothetical protein